MQADASQDKCPNVAVTLAHCYRAVHSVVMSIPVPMWLSRAPTIGSICELILVTRTFSASAEEAQVWAVGLQARASQRSTTALSS